MSISNFRLRQAARQLDYGEVLAYPTEAVYGLGCDPLNENAVRKILELKQRPMDKGLILIASDFEQIEPYIKPDDAILERILPTWPGPVTWIVPVQPWVPNWLTGKFDSLAVRVTAHPLAKSLCEAYGGPMVSTSANPAGKPPATTSIQVLKYFSEEELEIVKGDVGELGRATPIYNALDGSSIRF